MSRRGKNNDDDNIIPMPPRPCPPHIWEPIYNDEGDIVGRICTKCGLHEGRWS